jgi:hypothetical protein
MLSRRRYVDAFNREPTVISITQPRFRRQCVVLLIAIACSMQVTAQQSIQSCAKWASSRALPLDTVAQPAGHRSPRSSRRSARVSLKLGAPPAAHSKKQFLYRISAKETANRL